MYSLLDTFIFFLSQKEGIPKYNVRWGRRLLPSRGTHVICVTSADRTLVRHAKMLPCSNVLHKNLYRSWTSLNSRYQKFIASSQHQTPWFLEVPHTRQLGHKYVLAPGRSQLPPCVDRRLNCRRFSISFSSPKLLTCSSDHIHLHGQLSTYARAGESCFCFWAVGPLSEMRRESSYTVFTECFYD